MYCPCWYTFLWAKFSHAPAAIGTLTCMTSKKQINTASTVFFLFIFYHPFQIILLHSGQVITSSAVRAPQCEVSHFSTLPSIFLSS